MFNVGQLLIVPFTSQPRPFVRSVSLVSEWGIVRDGHGMERPVKMDVLLGLNPVATITAALPPRILLTLEVADDDDGYLFDGIDDDPATDTEVKPAKPAYDLNDRVKIKDFLEWKGRQGQSGRVVKVENTTVGDDPRQLLTVDFADGTGKFFDAELDPAPGQPEVIRVQIERDPLRIAMEQIADYQFTVERLQDQLQQMRSVLQPFSDTYLGYGDPKSDSDFSIMVRVRHDWLRLAHQLVEGKAIIPQEKPVEDDYEAIGVFPTGSDQAIYDRTFYGTKAVDEARQFILNEEGLEPGSYDIHEIMSGETVEVVIRPVLIPQEKAS